MAWALPQAGDRLLLQLFYTDINLQDGKTITEIPFDTDLSTTLANALAHAVLRAAVSGAKVESGNIIVPIFDSAAAAAAAGSTVFHDGQLTLSLDVSGAAKTKTGIVHIPSPAVAVRAAAEGNKGFFLLDTADAAITALEADFEAGGGATLSDGQQATGIDAGPIRLNRKRPKVT